MSIKKNKVLHQALVWSAALYGPYLLIHAGPILGTGPWSIPGAELMLLLVFILLLIVLLFLPFLFFKKTRSGSFRGIIVTITLIALLFPVFGIAYKLRMYGFELTAKRAEPLIYAIQKYKLQNDQLPEKLDMLVPNYIEKIPYGLPPLKIGREGKDRWSLSAEVSTGNLFVYNSDQDYSSSTDSVERISEWAYIHE